VGIIVERHARDALYNGFDSAELEGLPDAVIIRHATPYESGPGTALRSALRLHGHLSVCDRVVDVLMPQRFDVTDPGACAQCVAVVLAGLSTTRGRPS
jgi:hypothetical protein